MSLEATLELELSGERRRYSPLWKIALLDGLRADKFNSEWRQCSEVQRCSITELEYFVMAHYLAKRPAIVMLALKMLVRNQPVGMVIYSAPPREADKRYGGKTWELARLYLLDEIPRNAETWLIGRSVRYIKAHNPEVKYLLHISMTLMTQN